MNIVRLDEIPWEDRVNVDNWPSRGGTYYNNPETELCIRLIDYSFGAIEPRHVHPGTHATTVLKNTTIVDGLTLGPLDVVIGPSNEPHGPLEYPIGCYLLSAFQGSFYHSEVETLSEEKHYRLVQHTKIDWVQKGDGCRVKTLVDHGCGRLLVEAIRMDAGASLKPEFLGALLHSGGVSVGGTPLGEWDFIYADDGEPRDDVVCTSDATLLALTMRDADA